VSLLNFPIAVWFSLLPTVFVPMTYLSTIRTYKKIQIIDAEVTINKNTIMVLAPTIKDSADRYTEQTTGIKLA
jgi:hypothetical protein